MIALVTSSAGYAVLQAPVTFGWRGRGGRTYPGEIRYTNAPLIQAAVLQAPVSLRIAELYVAHGRVFAEGPPLHIDSSLSWIVFFFNPP